MDKNDTALTEIDNDTEWAAVVGQVLHDQVSRGDTKYALELLKAVSSSPKRITFGRLILDGAVKRYEETHAKCANVNHIKGFNFNDLGCRRNTIEFIRANWPAQEVKLSSLD